MDSKMSLHSGHFGRTETTRRSNAPSAFFTPADARSAWFDGEQAGDDRLLEKRVLAGGWRSYSGSLLVVGVQGDGQFGRRSDQGWASPAASLVRGCRQGRLRGSSACPPASLSGRRPVCDTQGQSFPERHALKSDLLSKVLRSTGEGPFKAFQTTRGTAESETEEGVEGVPQEALAV